MQTIAPKTKGGKPAAKPTGMNLEPASNDGSHAPSYPQPANRTLTDQDTSPLCPGSPVIEGQDEVYQIFSTTICRTLQDAERRESYDVLKMDARPSIRTYSFGEYGDLRTVMINGEVWSSLEDAAWIAGVIPASITGFLPEGELPVRGKPGHLNPDGVRYLAPQGISCTGIRIEALVPHFEDARAGSFLSERLQAVLKDAYTDLVDGKYAGGFSTRAVGPVRLPAEGIKLWQYRYYEQCLGELRAVVIGTEVWVNVADVSRCTPLGTDTIKLIAGQSRVTRIDNPDLANADEPLGSSDYVRVDAVIKLWKAIEHMEFGAEALERWIAEQPLLAWVMSLSADTDSDC
jgi:hypothetical protein